MKPTSWMKSAIFGLVGACAGFAIFAILYVLADSSGALESFVFFVWDSLGDQIYAFYIVLGMLISFVFVGTAIGFRIAKRPSSKPNLDISAQ